MKITYLLPFIAFSLITSSCSDDNDADLNMAVEIASNYEGYTSGVFTYSPTPIVTNGEKISITANEDKTVNVIMTSNQWGTTTITNAIVSVGTNNSYIVAGEGTSTISMHGGTPSKYACVLTGAISADRKRAELTFTLPAVMGGTTIAFNLGSAPANLYIAGNFSGYSSAVFAYSPTPIVTEKESLTISANDDETVHVVFESNQWGTTTITNAEITTEENGSFSLSGTGISLMGMHGSEAKEYACQFTGIITADKSGADMSFILSVMGGTTITFHVGKAPQTEV